MANLRVRMGFSLVGFVHFETSLKAPNALGQHLHGFDRVGGTDVRPKILESAVVV